MQRLDTPAGLRTTQLAVAGMFFIMGFQYGSWVSRIPTIKAGLHLGDAQLGLLLLASGIGSLAALPLVPGLMARFGSKRLTFLTGLVSPLMLILLALAPDFASAAAVLAATGVVMSGLFTGVNTQGAILEARSGRAIMAKLHATFSLGLFVGALVASGVGLLTDALLPHFLLAAVVLYVILLLSRTRLLDGVLEKPERTGDSKRSLGYIAVFLGLAMAFASIAEGAMNDWTGLYLRDITHASEDLVPLGIAVFSGSMVVARLFADGWRTRFGDRPIVIGGSTLAGAGLGLALLVGGTIPAFIGFACVGVGMSAVVPCIFLAGAQQGPGTLSVISGMGTTGRLAGPPLIGFVSQFSNLAWGMALVALAPLVVAVCLTRVQWRPAPARPDDALATPDPA
ncbi:MFS transporter [Pseudonocardiaceae bacterium YIM PH 21723]|nr:MFS transporter [Pseudonocardiaceae bacterium YIM PH 21723]